MNYSGIIIGLATFLTIGAFHPLVIKAEYHFGRRCWWAFLLCGIISAAVSLLCKDQTPSIILGVVAFSSFWGIGEVFAQHNRVKKGWFPMNPKRRKDYE